MNTLLGTDKDGRKLVEGQKAFRASLVAQPQAAMVVEPRQGALHYPSRLAQARAVRVVLGPRQLRLDAALPRGADVLFPAPYARLP